MTRPLPSLRAVWLSLLLFMMLAALVGTARATPHERVLEATDSGTLWLREGDGAYRAAPGLATDVTIEVTALVARATVRQRFRNPGRDWIEGVYVFPLPETTAVDTMRLRIGERVIEGQVQERAEAQRTYAAAKASGRRASLLEQERPNVFTTSVANIGPGEEIEVEIGYQQAVDYRDGEFRLRFPTVVGPRFIPGQSLPEATVTEEVRLAGGWALATDAVPDAPRITPPVREPGEGDVNRLTIDVRLRPGVPLASIVSAHHPVREEHDVEGYRVTLAEGPVPADRDFELSWRPVPAHQPRASLFSETVDGTHYALLTVLPPSRPAADQPRPPRDLLLVLDVSGSMHGASIAQARAALDAALGRLEPGDRFNVIAFNNSAWGLFPEARTAAPGNVAAARRWVGRLEASGGTRMAAALRLALAGEGDEGAGRLRQVVFLTDGAVGNEAGLFKLIDERLGDARLFTVGIGSAPNSHFMRRAARHGRGSFVHVGSSAQVGERIDELLRKLDHPALTDVRLELPEGVAAEVLPDPVPDLYLHEPVQVRMRLPSMPDRATLTGRIGSRAWHADLQLDAAEASGLGRLWARAKIGQLMDRHRRAGGTDMRRALRDEVVALALTHHLVSRFTSLVAVDVTPARTRDALIESRHLATELPHGWSYDKVFGATQTATPAPLMLAFGLLLCLVALWLRRRAWP
jgi:Ca-activated chloride channel family protein